MSFELLGLSEELLKAVHEAGYDTPTPIQRQAIPPVLMGRDVIGIAQTGTGKTASFVLPMLDVLAQGRARARMPRSLILEPTRELAAQVAENFEKYGKYYKLNMALLIGGVSFSDQETKLERGVDVLIATPGRLLDHFERGKLMMTGVELLVVDECDRMLDMGFIPDVERICKLMPQKHQTLFFSATLSKEIKRLTDQFLTDPKLIEVAPPASPAKTVTQTLAVVGPRDKSKALKALLSDPDVNNAIVFCNRKVDVKSVTTSLKRAKFNVGQLHGDMAQADRMDMLARFKAGEVTILIASDVAARGLDIPRVSHVFNYDVPFNAEDYVHRIGRTGRAGRSGVAVTIALPSDARNVADIEKLIGGKLNRASIPDVRQRPLEGEDEGDVKDTPAAAAQPAETNAKAETETAVATPADDSGGDSAATTESPKKPAGRSGKRRRKPSQRSGSREAPASTDAPAETADRQPARREPQNRKSASRSGEGAGPNDGGRNTRGKGKSRREQDDSRVVGLGDHVPGFLARPVPPRKPSKSED